MIKKIKIMNKIKYKNNTKKTFRLTGTGSAGKRL